MTEVKAAYTVSMQEPARPVDCPNCGVNIGAIVSYNGARWLAVGNILVPHLPGSTLCAGCGQPVYFGQSRKAKIARPGVVWDGKKFVKVGVE